MKRIKAVINNAISTVVLNVRVACEVVKMIPGLFQKAFADLKQMFWNDPETATELVAGTASVVVGGALSGLTSKAILMAMVSGAGLMTCLGIFAAGFIVSSILGAITYLAVREFMLTRTLANHSHNLSDFIDIEASITRFTGVTGIRLN